MLEADRRFDSALARPDDWNQTYSAGEYRILILWYSSTQMMDESHQVGLLDDMESFIRNEFGG